MRPAETNRNRTACPRPHDLATGLYAGATEGRRTGERRGRSVGSPVDGGAAEGDDAVGGADDACAGVVTGRRATAPWAGALCWASARGVAKAIATAAIRTCEMRIIAMPSARGPSVGSRGTTLLS